MAVVRPAVDSFDSNLTTSFLRGLFGLGWWSTNTHTLHKCRNDKSCPHTRQKGNTKQGMSNHNHTLQAHTHTHTHTLTLTGVSSRSDKGHRDSHTEAAHTGPLTGVMTDPLAASSAETQANSQYHSEQACDKIGRASCRERV